jgi:hypothetical protein
VKGWVGAWPKITNRPKPIGRAEALPIFIFGVFVALAKDASERLVDRCCNQIDILCCTYQCR